MQYNDSRIQYDSSLVNYDGSWAITIAETSTISESLSNKIQTAISEAITMTESIAIFRIFHLIIQETVTLSETMAKSVQTTFKEVLTMSETYARKITHPISETITMSEKLWRMFNIHIYETVTIVETLIANIADRIRGAIQVVKEFARLSLIKERVDVKLNAATQNITIIRLNAQNTLYDLTTLKYDDANTCYDDTISSEKIIGKISRKNERVRVNQSIQDKPRIERFNQIKRNNL